MAEGSLFVGAAWRDGWVAVAFDAEGFARADVFEDVGGLWGACADRAERVLVDVPVGLVEEGDPERACDAAARAVLGPRSDAIVTPPVREAARKRRFPAAQRTHERKTGAALAERAFALSEGIVAVEELLREVPEARAVVRASHPEVCLRAFAGGSLSHDPATAGGYAERLRALATFDRDAPAVVQRAAAATAGHPVTVAHVVDAVALGYTAAPGPGTLRTLPADPPTDAAGLPMEIVYRAAAPLAE